MASETGPFCTFCCDPVRVPISDGGSGGGIPPDLTYIRLISRYLKIAPRREDKNEEDEGLVVCDVCANLGKCFHDLYQHFEVIRLKMDWIVERIYGRMRLRRMDEGEVEKRMSGSVQKWRKELITKCHLELKKSCQNAPKVILRRLDENDDEEKEGSPPKKPKYLPINIKREVGVEIKSEPEEVFTNVELLMRTLSFLAVLALTLPQEPPERQYFESDIRIVAISSLMAAEEETEEPSHGYGHGQHEETADYDDFVLDPLSPSYQPPYQDGEQMCVKENSRNEEEDEDDIQIIEPGPNQQQPIPIQIESTASAHNTTSGPAPAILAAAIHHFNQQKQSQTPSTSNDVHLRKYPNLRHILNTPPNTDVTCSNNTSSSNSPTQIFSTTFHPPQETDYQQQQLQEVFPSSHSSFGSFIEIQTQDPVPPQSKRRIQAVTLYPPVLPPQPNPPKQPIRNNTIRTAAPPAATSTKNIHDCFVCKMNFSTEEEVALHRVVKHNLMYFLRCQGCRSVFSTDTGLKKHQMYNQSTKCSYNMNANPPPVPQRCNNFQFQRAAPSLPPRPPALPKNLTLQLETTSPVNKIMSVQTPPPTPQIRSPVSYDPQVPSPTQCEICLKTFPTESELESHRGADHNLVQIVRCHACGSRFASHSSLKRHQERNRLTQCNPNPDPEHILPLPPPSPLPTPQVQDNEAVEVVQLPPQISWRILSENEPRRAPLVSISTPMPPEAVLLPPIRMPTPPPPPPPVQSYPPVPNNWEGMIVNPPTSGTVPLALPKCAMCNDYFRSAAQLIIHLRLVHKVNQSQQENSSNVQVINLD
ncbi:unnamed protein product [Orchesella dallaii]|uniref:C2H2-type domain-containing protein n=1 Tax=Orchesella dallaii TaxID=48710 RepID=A0ABP1QDD1_9HEXA